MPYPNVFTEGQNGAQFAATPVDPVLGFSTLWSNKLRGRRSESSKPALGRSDITQLLEAGCRKCCFHRPMVGLEQSNDPVEGSPFANFRVLKAWI